jgi:hypothetical protein
MTLITFHPQHPPLTRQQLLEELRGKERALLDFEQDLLAIAEAVWPEDCVNEAPQLYRAIGQYTVGEIVAGVKSLHHLTDRLTDESERLLRENAALREALRERGRGRDDQA